MLPNTTITLDLGQSGNTVYFSPLNAGGAHDTATAAARAARSLEYFKGSILWLIWGIRILQQYAPLGVSLGRRHCWRSTRVYLQALASIIHGVPQALSLIPVGFFDRAQIVSEYGKILMNKPQCIPPTHQELSLPERSILCARVPYP